MNKKIAISLLELPPSHQDQEPMKAYSVDLRSKIVAAHLDQKLSIRKTAEIFACSKSIDLKNLELWSGAVVVMDNLP